jgi:hypothetical protein
MWNSPWLMLNCQRLIELWHKHLFWDGLRISTVFGVSCLQVWSWRPLRHKETTYGASRPDAKGLKIMSTKEFGIWDIGMVMRQGIPGCLTIQTYGDVIKHDIAGRAWALGISWWYHQKKTQFKWWSPMSVGYQCDLYYLYRIHHSSRTASENGQNLWNPWVNLHLIPDVSMGL